MPKDAAIHKAAYKGDAGTVEDLLDSKVDVNTKGAQNRSPLHRAVGKGHNEVVQLLIERKAQLDSKDSGGLEPLHWAALFGLVATGGILVTAGGNVDAQVIQLESCASVHACSFPASAVDLWIFDMNIY